MDLLAQFGIPIEAYVIGLAVSGLVIGSFLNVVIHRIPIMMERQWKSTAEELLADTPDAPSTGKACRAADEEARYNLVTPGSTCTACDAPIGVRDNIPVVSYLLLRGRCRHCGGVIPARYPIVETTTAILFVAVGLAVASPLALAGALLFVSILVTLGGIDLDHGILPDELCYGLLWIGLLLSLDNTFMSPRDAIIGAAAGYVSLWSIHHIFRLTTGREGMGHGDFKLLAAIGAWIGWSMLPLAVFIAAIAGIVIGTGFIVAGVTGRFTRIPFGPFLAIGGLVSLCWGDSFLQIIRTIQ